MDQSKFELFWIIIYQSQIRWRKTKKNQNQIKL